MMNKSGFFVLLVVAVISDVEGLKLKTVSEGPKERLFRTTPKEAQAELLDLDQEPGSPSLDFYQDSTNTTSTWPDCSWTEIATISDATWEGMGYDGKLTPTNYCHAHSSGGATWFCIPDSGSGATCKNTQATGVCDSITSSGTVFPTTADGWEWDELPYDASFKCGHRKNSKYDYTPGTSKGYGLNTCLGPVPSDSCSSNTAYCWESKCIDVHSDPAVCNYAPHGTTKGKLTDDGWSWSDLNYDLRAGCFTQEVNPVAEAFTPAEWVADGKGMFEPARQLFMQRYLIWCQLSDWKNNRQKRISNGRTYGRATNLDCDIGRASFDTPR